MTGEDDPYRTTVSRPSRTRLIIALVLLAFVGGLGVMAWVMTHWQGGVDVNQAVTGQPSPENVAAPAPGPALSSAPTPTETTSPMPTDTAESLDARMLDIEQRMMRISVAAQAASGYANRAEAMMVAFAARRALDTGTPLGYLEGQLRLLFGEAQPKAVATIVNAAAEPVTINKLRAGLEDIRLRVEQGDPNEGWWHAAMRELGSLVVIRRSDAEAPEPEQRIAHARRAIEAGQIEDAISDVAAMPQQPVIAQWLEQARRYNEAHRALDVIEAAAILEPRAAPLVAPTAETRAPAQGAGKRR